MKRVIILSVLMTSCILALSQIPESFSYQVVVRDGVSNNPLTNQNVSFRMSILKGSSSGESQYSELHSANTGAMGIVNLVIGNGTGKIGSIAAIDWGADIYFLKVEIDKTGESSYIEMGTTQLLSVPYALYAKESGQGVSGNNEGEMLYWDGDKWITVAPGAHGQFLSFCNGVPTWGKCLPIVTTGNITDNTGSHASVEGNVIDGGGYPVISRGICYDINPEPAIEDNISYSGSGTGPYTCNLLNLSCNVTYYARAFATTSVGTAYGNDVTFNTSCITPTVSTSEIDVTGPGTADASGIVTDDGGQEIIQYGFCWSTDPDPTIDDFFTDEGNGTATIFILSSLSGLETGNTYYARAYAINDTGISYGEIKSFSMTLPAITTETVTNIYGTKATGGGTITDPGGSVIIEAGICWGTEHNPTLDNFFKTTDSFWDSPYTLELSGLDLTTEYYVRAYAKNLIGISYGDEVAFTTADLSVGDSWEGGIVAYSYQPGDPGYIEGEQRILIAAPEDQGNHTWGAAGRLLGTTSTLLGAGYGNTLAILDFILLPCAAQVCNDLELNDYDDWYLPSKDELDKLYQNRVEIGAFSSPSTQWYWSSSEYGEQYAWGQSGPPGWQLQQHVNNYATVHCVRTTPYIIPAVTTTEPSSITFESAVSGGNIIMDGGDPVTARGVVWSRSGIPSLESNDGFTADDAGTGVFTSSLTNLSYNTNYKIRAYATNRAGTAYGKLLDFYTLPGLPVVVIAETLTGQVTIQVEADVEDNREGTMVARGVVWSTPENPTLESNEGYTDIEITDGSGLGYYQNMLSGLAPSTTYYIRAYATNTTGTSYSDQVSITTLVQGGGESCTEYPSVTDVDGNIYNTVLINGQCWMKENLKTTQYNDGSPIDYFLSTDEEWEETISGSYFWLFDDSESKDIYGALYNWYAASSANLCPTGWHVPSETEMSDLITYLGGTTVAGNKLKSTRTSPDPEPRWISNIGATDETGFSAYPGQWLSVLGFSQNNDACWWTATEESGTGNPYYMTVSGWNPDASVSLLLNKQSGMSIRCIKD